MLPGPGTRPSRAAISSTIPRVADLTLDEFRSDYLLPNLPVIVKNATCRWLARSTWVTRSGQPNLEAFRIFGGIEVPVTRCSNEEHTSSTMRLSEYLEHWKAEGDEPLYCKDWHFTHTTGHPELYELPCFLTDDWLNEYCDHQRGNDSDPARGSDNGGKPAFGAGSDYRFVYMGPKGTWTPFHCDVFGSFSWSANIVGRKRWVFYHPEETPLFTCVELK
eukprot:TRINITY_DN2761_c0_g1_i1.p1 TRINITY_DN2761_c0_g1~~TRINITY_DN2761_c0_g1_i1.p1  ORF type:complete len:226 (-),score=16.76 TRINITY_DN2761_c0_g1_i1:486-1142(-)